MKPIRSVRGFETPGKQRGLSLSGLILALIGIGLAAIIGMQVIPAYIEYESIKKAVADAKSKGSTPAEIEAAFDRQVNAGYITSVHGKDLTIVNQDGQYVISFAYDKKLHLFGPASLLLEFTGSTNGST